MNKATELFRCGCCGEAFQLGQGVSLPDGSFLCDSCDEYSDLSNFVGSGKTIVKTERGWPGHYDGWHYCGFRRNTLVECGDIKIVVSTIGNFCPDVRYGMDGFCSDTSPEKISLYETVCFMATQFVCYLDADKDKKLSLPILGDMNIPKGTPFSMDLDNRANEMHDNVVFEVTRLITSGKISEYLPHKEVKQ